MSSTKNLKRKIELILRQIGLDPVIYHYVCWKNQRRFAASNRAFHAANPHLMLPPPQLRFDVIACSSAEYYFTSGQKMAAQINAVIKQWAPSDTRVVYEWGCGPGRILFPLAALDETQAIRFAGSDAFTPSIRWAQSVPNSRIAFHLNKMEPPLDLPGSSVDFVYAVSVFTHLSDKLTRSWFAEIMRILKPGGIFWFSTHSGRNHEAELTPIQREQLSRGEFVAIHSWHNGSQLYTGIHCPDLMSKVITQAGGRVLDYQPGGNNTFQDAWIVKKC